MTGRKMSGKYCCEVHFSDPDCPCTKRIAELEAELAKRPHDYRDAMCCYEADQEIAKQKARAEKAEAEVKSLLSQKPRENGSDWMAHIRSCPDPKCASESRARAHMAARKERDDG